MRLPPNFAREWVNGTMGTMGKGTTTANGWKVRIGNKIVFLRCALARHPGKTRETIETVLGLKKKAVKSDEEIVTSRVRHRALLRRTFRNRLARGDDVTPPWEMARTVRGVANEQRALDIAEKWQRMGEYRR